jgi:hypothetical protein
MGFLFLFLSASTIFAGTTPIILEVPGQTPIVVADYTMEATADPLQMKVHIGPEAAEALRELSGKNIGRQLQVKQGDRVLFTPTIKAVLESQDLMLSFK